MNKLGTYLMAFSTVTMMSVLHFEDRLNIVIRAENGTIYEDVARVQGGRYNLGKRIRGTVIFSLYDKAIHRHVRQVKCARGKTHFCPPKKSWN